MFRIRMVLGLMLVACLAASPVLAEKVQGREWVPLGPRDPTLNPALPMIMVQAGDTAWVNVHMDGSKCPGSSTRGGEATGSPGAAETWCFEGGPHDSVSTGPLGAGTHAYTWTHFDRRMVRDQDDSLYWHATTFHDVGSPTGRSMWCGGFNNRCGTWLITSGGYGNQWTQIMQLDLSGGFNVSQGCSLQFRTAYVVECNYDYSYLEFYSFKNTRWQTVDVYNGKSGCTVVAPSKTCHPDWNNYRVPALCPGQPWGTALSYPTAFITSLPRDYPGYPYVGPSNAYVLVRGDSISSTPSSVPTLRFRWRFTSDPLWSSELSGQPDAKGWWVDDIVVKTRTAAGSPFTHTQNFNIVPEGGLPSPGVNYVYSFPKPDSVFDNWALRYDLDPPMEGFFLPSPGDSGVPSACQLNASWQWSLTPSGVFIPPTVPPQRSPYLYLQSPAIPLNYSEGAVGPFDKPGCVWQYDDFQNMLPETCDFTDTEVRVHKASVPGWDPVNGAWCQWQNIDNYVLYGGGTFWAINRQEDVTRFSTQAGLDSIRFSWSMIDNGAPGDACWDPGLPPHVDSQYVVDNVSVGIFDGSATSFATDRSFNFQDTFNLLTCLHNANVANNDIRMTAYTLRDKSESLNVTVMDANGLVAGHVWLMYSTDDSVTWNAKVMNLSEPSLIDPTQGGIFRTTLCPSPSWTPGTQFVYYIKAQDDLGNIAYLPRQANPADPGYPVYYNVRILPSPGARILLVDDIGGRWPDYHPCRTDTVLTPIRDSYGNALEALGYRFMKPGAMGTYDRYSVQAPSSNQRINEPWGFWTASPDSPAAGTRTYDIVMWTTGPSLNLGTVHDTTQTFLKQFVFHGGRLLMTGDRIGQEMSDPLTPQDVDFYGNLLGAQYVTYGSSGTVDANRFPTAPNPPVGPVLVAGDSLHIFSGCPYLRDQMDKITLKTAGLPSWSHPTRYLIYDDATAPYDSLAGIYSFVTYTPDTGKVVYLPFSFEAVVDRFKQTCDPPPGGPMTTEDVGYGKFNGRQELMRDILRIFGANVTTVPGGATPQLVTALHQPQPNPFNPETVLHFSLAAEGRVTLTVFDVTGRRVRTLVDKVLGAGDQRVTWNGRDEAGHQVASGVYFARMETAGFRATEKMTLLK